MNNQSVEEGPDKKKRLEEGDCASSASESLL